MEIVDKGIYFLKQTFLDELKEIGTYTDHKQRPIVALVPSSENESIYWAIPMGDFSHRTEEQKARLQTFLDYPESDIRSCYYHKGSTNKVSIFFISDVIPITNDCIEREYSSHGSIYVIKNKKLIAELQRKMSRILAYDKAHVASKGTPAFRQNISGIYNMLKLQLNSMTEENRVE